MICKIVVRTAILQLLKKLRVAYSCVILTLANYAGEPFNEGFFVSQNRSRMENIKTIIPRTKLGKLYKKHLGGDNGKA